MSWYILQCRIGQEETIIRSCRQHISTSALDHVFSFNCERLWRSNGFWKPVKRGMFPGYVFLESSRPEELSRELETYRRILKVMEEADYLISVYDEEEQYLKKLCGEHHYLGISYGCKTREKGISIIDKGPLKGFEKYIIKYDWHRRFAQVEIPLSGKKMIVWAGIEYKENILERKAFVS